MPILDSLAWSMSHCPVLEVCRWPAGLNEDFNVSAGDERTVAELAEVIWRACGRPADAFRLEQGPTFEVDVVRRWPSVQKAKDLLGWEAQIELEDGIRQTVDWLRAELRG